MDKGGSEEDMTNFKQEEVTLAGVLVPDQWANNGEITGYALCTDDEQKYMLLCGTEKIDLADMLHRSIKVSGVVTGDTVEKSIIVTTLDYLSDEEILEKETRHHGSMINSVLVSW